MSNERYELGELLGRGGMAEVYRAYDRVSEMEVAIKMLHRHLIDDHETVEKLSNEAMIMQGLDHPSVLRVHELTEIDGRPAMVMDLCTGGDVKTRLQRQGPMSQEEATRIGVAVLDVLAMLHSQGMLHRDIKPQNIMFNDEDRPILIDFGIGHHGEGVLRGRDAQLGTVEYMAPERFDGMAIDGRSDLYSLGITLFEMVCGHVPYRAESTAALVQMHMDDQVPDPSFFAPELEGYFSRAIQRAMARYPEERFDQAKEMSAALLGEGQFRHSIESHAYWQRLREDFGEEGTSLSVIPGEMEWAVALDEKRVKERMQIFQVRGLCEVLESFPEFHDRYESEMSGHDPTRWNDHLLSKALARGLSRRGAEELMERLEKRFVPVIGYPVPKRVPPWGLIWAALLMLTYGPLSVMLIGAVMDQSPEATANMMATVAALLIPAGIFATAAGFLMSRIGVNFRGMRVPAEPPFFQWFLLDFRKGEESFEGSLVGITELKLADSIRSPRTRASFERIMSDLLHLRDLFRRYGIDAEQQLKRLLGDTLAVVNEIVKEEAALYVEDSSRLVQELEVIDRLIDRGSDLENLEELMEKKSSLRSRLDAHDESLTRMESKAQHLLSKASLMEDLVHKYWKEEGPEALTLEELVVLDFRTAHSEPGAAMPASASEQAVSEEVQSG